MTTAVIGTGRIGASIARHLAGGGEPVRVTSADGQRAKKLAAEIGALAEACGTNREAVEGAENVILAVWLEAMKGVIDGLADALPEKLVIETSNPVSVAAYGNLSRTLPDGQSSGETVLSWLPPGAHFAKAFGTLPADLLASSANRSPKRAVLFYATDDPAAAEAVEQLIRAAGFDPVSVGGIDSSTRIEVGGDLHASGGLDGRLVEHDEAVALVANRT